MKDFSGSPIEPQVAWQLLDQWKSSRHEIGIIFWGRMASLYAIAVVDSTKYGRVRFLGDTAGTSFNLKDATFKYGPMQTWPRWPSPPIVEVNALRAEFSNGDYLVLAAGLTRQALSSPMLGGE
jgi:hypothetical protein